MHHQTVEYVKMKLEKILCIF